MKRKQQLLSWIMALILAFAGLPAMGASVFAQTYDRQGAGFETTTLKGGDIITDAKNLKVYYFNDENTYSSAWNSDYNYTEVSQAVYAMDVETSQYTVLSEQQVNEAAVPKQLVAPQLGYKVVDWKIKSVVVDSGEYPTQVFLIANWKPVYTVTDNFYNINILENINEVISGNDLTLTLQATPRYFKLPDNINVTMQGNTAPDYTYNKDTGALTVRNVTGNVVISGNADPKSILIEALEILGASSIVNGKTMMMEASFLPSDATDRTLTWSVINGTGSATIDSNGLLTATGVGTVTVKATANGSGVVATKTIIVTSGDVLSVLVDGMEIWGEDSVANGGKIQINAAVLPTNATNKTLTWSVINGTGAATIDSNGLLTATAAGTVTVKATANDGSGVVRTKIITVTSSYLDNNNGSGRHTVVYPFITVATLKHTTTATIHDKVKTNSDNLVAIGVTQSIIDQAIVKAAQEAKIKGATKTIIEIKAEDTDTKNFISTIVPKDAITSIIKSGAEALAVSTPIAAAQFGENDLSALLEKAKGDINLTITKLDISKLKLNEAMTRPAYEITMISAGQNLSSLVGKATIRMPYKLTAAEDANNLVVSTVSDSGELTKLINTRYDVATQMVSCTLAEASKIIIGYQDIKFKDVSGKDADYVNYLAARDIVKGNEGLYLPNDSITRAEFVQILASMSNGALSQYKNSEFEDVKVDAWYNNAVQWAYENHIVSGVGDNKFAPDAPITHEQMIVMLYNYAQWMKVDVSNIEGNAINEFSDVTPISTWAKTAIRWALNAGIVSLKDNDHFAPQTNATRAEVAKAVALFLQNIAQ